MPLELSSIEADVTHQLMSTRIKSVNIGEYLGG
jgi:hypothetical protein